MWAKLQKSIYQNTFYACRGFALAHICSLSLSAAPQTISVFSTDYQWSVGRGCHKDLPHLCDSVSRCLYDKDVL